MKWKWPFRSEELSFGNTLFLNDDYRLTIRESEPDLAVISFCGVGLQLGGVQTEEFRSSLGTKPTAYYVADLHRSWWNNSRVEEVIEAALEHASRRNPAVRFVTIGNSMGGSGAVLAAHLYSDIVRCVAFVPQVDVRLCFDEPRWMEYRQAIRRHRWNRFALPPACPAADCRLVFGDRVDQAHRAGFAAAGFRPRVYSGYGHKVAKELRNRQPEEYRRLLRGLLD